MKKVTLYSKSGRARTDVSALNRQSGVGPESEAVPVQDSGRRRYAARIRKFMARHERFFLVVSAGLVSMLLMIAYTASQPPVRQITQRNIDAAVMHTLDTNVLPSPETKAFNIVQRSVVRVRQLGQLQDKDPDRIRGVGTGVVIVDNGTILTNLHVVAGAERVQVVFFDGLVSDAAVIALQPENDLAVLQAMTIPDDLVPATLRSTADLAMGDKVIAVGFPFGLGPSVSSGIVSGLKREYQSPEGKRLLTNLIQFDAAANPGNSGGPLVTMDGAVVGIVTGILNPTVLRVFIGIGFAVPIENAATAAGTPPF